MKKINVLIASVALFLASVNVVSAQELEINTNGSIYGLEAFFVNDYVINFSFYSTYNVNELKTLIVELYKDDIEVIAMGYYYRQENAAFDILLSGEARIEYIDSDVYKITVRNCTIPENFKVNQIKELYLLGQYSSSNSGGMEIQESSWWQSNVLTAFISETSSLNETFTDNDIITYKYFLLSGIECEIMPVGVPFIQVVYKNGVVIDRKKCFLK